MLPESLNKITLFFINIIMITLTDIIAINIFLLIERLRTREYIIMILSKRLDRAVD